MNSTEYISLINAPHTITDSQIEKLGIILDNYPYFQSARIVRLKGLYMQNSFKYNYALKVTAAHTTDRAVLLDLISSDSFVTIQKREQEFEQKQIEKVEELEEELEEYLEATVIEAKKTEKIPLTKSENQEKTTKENILKESILTSIKESSPVQKKEIIEALEEIKTEETQIIKKTTPPIAFSLNEKHSFQEWLQLSTLKPIDRSVEKTIKTESIIIEEPLIKDVVINKAVMEQKAIITTSQEPEKKKEIDLEKKKKELLIEKFILSSPKIPPIRHISAPTIQIDINKDDHSDLMTETLARIYLEQKKYTKAIQAYQILILKYPEKSSYFADCISDIKNLQQNN